MPEHMSRVERAKFLEDARATHARMKTPEFKAERRKALAAKLKARDEAEKAAEKAKKQADDSQAGAAPAADKE